MANGRPPLPLWLERIVDLFKALWYVPAGLMAAAIALHQFRDLMATDWRITTFILGGFAYSGLGIVLSYVAWCKTVPQLNPEFEGFGNPVPCYPRAFKAARWILVLLVVLSLWAAERLYGLDQKLRKSAVVLVADLAGSRSESVRDRFMRQLELVSDEYRGVSIRSLDKVISGPSEARELKGRYRAAVLVWGAGDSGEGSLELNGEDLRVGRVPMVTTVGPQQLRRVGALDPGSFRVHANLEKQLKALSLYVSGVALYDKEDYAGAVRVLTAAFNAAILTNEELNWSDLFFYRGTAYYSLRGLSEAIDDYSRAIQIYPELAKAYYNRALAYSDLGRDERAIIDYDEAIRLAPGDAQAYNNRGIANALLGRHEKAIADYTEAIGIEPNYADAYYNRANSYSELIHTKDNKEYAGLALDDYNRALQINPKFPEAYNNRGELYRELGQELDAIADYTNAVNADPNFALAYFNRGNAFAQKEDYHSAVSDYSSAVFLNSQDSEALVNRGNAYAELAEIEKDDEYYLRAIEDYSKAIEISPRDADAFFDRADTYLVLNRKKEAMADFRMVLEIGSDPKTVQEVTKKLKQLRTQKRNMNSERR